MSFRHKLKTHAVLLIAGLACCCAPAGAQPAAADCVLSDGQVAHVVKVRANGNLQLQNGETIRLIGVMPVQIFKGARSPTAKKLNRLAEQAVAFLEGALQGRSISYHQPGRKRDRYGRLLAHAFTDKGVWIQGQLLARGYGRAYSFADNKACYKAMLRREAEARYRRRGLWGFRALQPVAADKLRLLLKRRYRYQLVEGRVHKVAQLRQWTFLNFTDDWKRDFSIAIKRKYRKKISADGLDLSALTGKRIRVRGWLERWNGPLIKVTHSEQIEVLDEEVDAAGR